MPRRFQNSTVESAFQRPLTTAGLTALEALLTDAGTFEFRALPNGLFPAAVAADYTGYSNVWVRDNVHLAHQFWVLGETDRAVANVRGLLAFFATQESKIDRIISRDLDPDEPMNRPHIRFNGRALAENEERWAHAQNDALGYFLWIACELIREGLIEPTREELRLLLKFSPLFMALQYWEDRDSGHWEEARKVEASSIGTAARGLMALQKLLITSPLVREVGREISVFSSTQLAQLISHGEFIMSGILPWECRSSDPGEAREYDGALLFLIYPLQILPECGDRAERILQNVREHLQGEVGIRRYLGDSYWCADYKDMLSEESRTADVSDDMSARDALLRPGEEAQWCIFDPIMSVIYGLRFAATGSAVDRQLQAEYLERSLAQITAEGGEKPAFRCPESYYLEHGIYVPNDVTPLLWTQANLRLALHQMKITLANTEA